MSFVDVTVTLMAVAANGFMKPSGAGATGEGSRRVGRRAGCRRGSGLWPRRSTPGRCFATIS